MSPDGLTHPGIAQLAEQSPSARLAIAAAERMAATLAQLHRERDRCLVLAEGFRAAFVALPGVPIDHPEGPALAQRVRVQLAQAAACEQGIRDVDQLAASLLLSALIVVTQEAERLELPTAADAARGIAARRFGSAVSLEDAATWTAAA
jgi:hypothetical protein